MMRYRELKGCTMVPPDWLRDNWYGKSQALYNSVILYWTSLKLHYIKIEEPLCLLCLLVWWQVAEAEWYISPLLAATPSYRKCGWFQGGRSGFLIDQGAIDLVCECTIDFLTICNTDRLLMPKDHLSRYGYLLSTHNEYSNGFFSPWNYCYLGGRSAVLFQRPCD